MAVIAKTDIQTLTKQLNLEKCNISESIKAEYVPIDPSFLNESFVLELDAKMKYLKITQKNTPNAEVPISLDELENMVGRFDGLDKMFSESKASKISNTTRKEVSTMKRFGSMADVNKTLLRSLSSQNLHTTKTFHESRAQASKLVSNQNPSSTSNGDCNSDVVVIPKLTVDQLIEHNSIGKEIEMRISSNQNDEKKQELNDITQMYKSSIDRLYKFCEEVQKIQASNSTESGDDSSLTILDQNVINLMEKISQALLPIRFIAENQNIYTTGIKENDPFLSDDLTDILEHFYRV